MTPIDTLHQIGEMTAEALDARWDTLDLARAILDILQRVKEEDASKDLTARSDAVSALLALGYSRKVSEHALQQIDLNLPAESQVVEALKRIRNNKPR